jgi:hypothetical protein
VPTGRTKHRLISTNINYMIRDVTNLPWDCSRLNPPPIEKGNCVQYFLNIYLLILDFFQRGKNTLASTSSCYIRQRIYIYMNDGRQLQLKCLGNHQSANYYNGRLLEIQTNGYNHFTIKLFLTPWTGGHVTFNDKRPRIFVYTPLTTEARISF